MRGGNNAVLLPLGVCSHKYDPLNHERIPPKYKSVDDDCDVNEVFLRKRDWPTLLGKDLDRLLLENL